VGAKAAGGDRHAATLDGSDELFVQTFGEFRFGSANETRPPAFAAIAQQGELADDQHLPADLQQGTIHFAFVILEDPQPRGLLCHVFDVAGLIVRGNAQQHEHAAIDLSHDFLVDDDTGPADALHAGSHERTSPPPALLCPALPPSRWE